MIIDCDRCEMRNVACDDCVVTFLLAAPPVGELADDEAGALAVLADGGLVPPLRMQPSAQRMQPSAPRMQPSAQRMPTTAYGT